MSETQGEYKILARTWEPQGEICLRYDEPEPVTEAGEVTDNEIDVTFLLDKIDGFIQEMNIGLEEIKPYIKQKQVMRPGMHGMKSVYRCMTKSYKALAALQRISFNIRNELENEI